MDKSTLGCANQAGEDNRNVARLALLLAGLPPSEQRHTVNRLCGSGMDAVLSTARAIRCGEADLVIAGGAESMTRAPFAMPKSGAAFARTPEVYDSTIGWRLVNPAFAALYGITSMPDTAQNVAADFAISRADQDAFAPRAQTLALAAQENGRLGRGIGPVTIPQRRGDPQVVSRDEHPRATTAWALASLSAPFRANGSVTAGNSSAG